MEGTLVMKDPVKISGHVVVKLNGKVIREGKNLVVDVGLALLAKLLAGTGTAPAFMAVGDNSATPTGGNTTLGHENHRVAATATVLGPSCTFDSTFTGQNVGTESVCEFGILNAATTGELLARFLCPTFDWNPDDLLTVTWTLTFGVAI